MQVDEIQFHLVYWQFLTQFYWSSAFHLYSPLPFKNKLTFSDKLRLHAFINVGNLASTIRDQDGNRFITLGIFQLIL